MGITDGGLTRYGGVAGGSVVTLWSFGGHGEGIWIPL